ncbi:12-oxophytodienoate reductase [Endozoicomonas atrinae]|uniref:oxidoreductase n=1 Tax=Endozoicomonas atrinae TaxID=1333660 RepID=UPI000825527E|nr:12-oxophytodienoate reductase [Endozoicomonas atrinae]
MPYDSSALFTPFSCGKLQLPNRIVMAPMTRNFADNWLPTSEMAAYYRRRVEGGTGFIISECTAIDHRASNAYEGVPIFYGRAALAKWKHIVDQVHEVGGKFAPQIWHAGPERRAGIGPDYGELGVGPVDAFEGGERIIRGLEKPEIHKIIESFAQAAHDAEMIGSDAVEIHGAHGYLIDKFLWHRSNQRTDEYGGALKNRLKFAVDIVRAIRGAVSDTFPVIFRFSQWKVDDYSAHTALTKHDLATIIQTLSDAGVDIFHVSTRRFWEPAFSDGPETLAHLFKKLSGKPVIAVGSIGLSRPLILAPSGQFIGAETKLNLDRLVFSFQNGEFDLCAVGRSLLANPDWANNVRYGRFESLKPFTAELLKELY